MKPKTPMMKALVGKQANLPQQLKEKILAAPETAKKGSPAKSYGSKTKSPVMKTKNPYGDVVVDTSTKEVKRKKSKGKNIVTTETVEKGRSASRAAKLQKSLENKDFDEAGRQSTMAMREGAQRIGTKTYVRQEKTGAKGSKGYMAGSTIAGTKTGPDGRTMKRTLKDGSKVVVEGSVSTIKKKGVAKGPAPKGAKVTKRALGVKEKTASQIKAKGATTSGKPSASAADLKKKETKGKAPVKSYGSKKKSPMMKTDPKKKETKGKRKLGTEGMSYKEKMAYYKKQKAAPKKKNPKIRMGMGSSYSSIKK